MFQTALIVFREVLEASLIVTIILAATRGVRGRLAWISAGVTSGMIGAGLVAGCTAYFAHLFDGSGQDIVNAGILFLAVGLIGWHILWMHKHGPQMAAVMRQVGHSVKDGTRHLSVLAAVVALAIMREGSEVVLMLQGLWAGQNDGVVLMAGAGFGFGAGIAAGAFMYLGFIVLPLARVFSVTNGLLIMIAAGMSARAADFLVQANWLDPVRSRVWDTSGIIPDHCLSGQFLAALIGYIARPSGIEVIFYLTTIFIVLSLMRFTKAKKGVVAACMVLICLIAAPVQASEVLSPYVTKGEFEVENQGTIAQDRKKDSSGEKTFIGAVGYSPTDFWKTEIEAEFNREAGPGHDLRYESVNWENTFQLTEPGEYLVDSGLFAEVDFTRAHQANNFVFGYLGAKQFGRVIETANLLLHKDVGSQVTATGLIYSSQTKYQVRPWLEPGFELYGDTNGKSRFDDQEFSAGPGLFGKIHTFDGQAIKYQIAYLLGATSATPDHAVRWKLEYEFFF